MRSSWACASSGAAKISPFLPPSPLLWPDGLDLAQFGAYPFVVGFTTNTALIKSAGLKSYAAVYAAAAPSLSGRPISFQVWEDSAEGIMAQATAIAALGPCAVVKIPKVNSEGVSNVRIISALVSAGTRVNVTAIFTEAQLDELHAAVAPVLAPGLPLVVSIFCGRIGDTGRDPSAAVRYAVARFKDLPSAKTLWAGCKDVTAIRAAHAAGCHIVTVPGDILSRVRTRLGMDLQALTVDTAKMFRADALSNGLQI